MRFDNDEQLAEAFNKGDVNAFKAIRAMYRQKMFTFSWQLTSNELESHIIVDSIFKDVETEMYKQLSTVTNIKAYLLITTRNRSYEYLHAIYNAIHNNDRPSNN